jgi:hypothetical protein
LFSAGEAPERWHRSFPPRARLRFRRRAGVGFAVGVGPGERGRRSGQGPSPGIEQPPSHREQSVNLGKGFGYEGGGDNSSSLGQFQTSMSFARTPCSDSEAIALVLSRSPATFGDVEDHAAGSPAELVSEIGVMKSNPLGWLTKRADAFDGQVMNVEAHFQAMRAELMPGVTPRNPNVPRIPESTGSSANNDSQIHLVPRKRSRLHLPLPGRPRQSPA